MSYLPQTTGVIKTKLLADTFYQDDGGVIVNSSFQYNSPSALNTGITLTSQTDFTVTAGSSWYLEASPGVRCNGKNGIAEIQFFNVTSSQWVGHSAYMCLSVTTGSSARQGRRVSRALILDSDITTSAIIQLRIKSISGSSWTMGQTATGLASINFTGAACLRAVELPT